MSKRSLSTQITMSKHMADNMALMLLGFKNYDIEGIEDVYDKAKHYKRISLTYSGDGITREKEDFNQQRISHLFVRFRLTGRLSFSFLN